MASIRRGFGDDLTLKNGNLGINTITAQEKIDVVGVVKGRDLYATGVSSLTAYEGFLRADNQIVESTTLEFGQGLKSSLSGEIIVGTGVTVTIGAVGLGTAEVGNGSGTIENTIDTTDINLAGGSQIECLKVYNTFTPPSGDTNERPYAPKPGELYYNYDFKTIEFFDGNGWRQVDNTTRSGRAVSAGGEADSNITTMEYVRIPTTGNGISFGDLAEARFAIGRGSSSTRGLFAGGDPGPSTSNRIEYVTIASEGNAIDFGDLTAAGRCFSGTSSSTRALFGGVNGGNTVNYVEIATLGDGISFGDLNNTGNKGYAVSSPTRAIFTGGGTYSRMDMMTIASKGNAIVFGEIGSDSVQKTGLSNSVRGIFAGGYRGDSPYYTETAMVYITIASAGNSQNFGDLVQQSSKFGGVSTQTRGLFIGGNHVNVGSINTMQYVTISTQGDAIDFGDAIVAASNRGNLSDSHGGLGGF